MSPLNWILLALVCGATAQPSLTMVRDWTTNYAVDIRDQGQLSMCWAFATTSYLEMMYAIRTRNRYRLSVEQISDGVPTHPAAREKCTALPNPAHAGGDCLCALEYVHEAGIMTEYDYPFTWGGKNEGFYNREYITPIGVNDTESSTDLVDGSVPAQMLRRFIEMAIDNYPVIVGIHGTNLAGLTDDIDETLPCNHAVFVVGYGTDNTANKDIWLKFQNSWGAKWGYGGYGYIRISDAGVIRNNRGILSEWIGANVYSMYSAGYVNDWRRVTTIVNTTTAVPNDAMPIAITSLAIVCGLIAVMVIGAVGIGGCIIHRKMGQGKSLKSIVMELHV